MKCLRYVVIPLLLLGCAARLPAAVRQNPLVSEFERLHAETKEFRRDIEYANSKIERPPKSTDPKYVAKALSLVRAALRDNRGLEGAYDDLALLIANAPPTDAPAAVASVEFVKRSWPIATILLELVRREKRLRQDLDDAYEKATLALARDQLSSQEMREITAFVTLIKRNLDAAQEASDRH